MQRFRFFILLSVSVWITGCMMGPDYIKPEIDGPDAFLFQEKEAVEAADTDWWKQFNDPVLDDLIAEALAHNKNVRIAAANVEQAKASLMQVRSPLFPQIGYGGAGARQRISESSAGALLPDNPYDSFQAAASATWELDLWGRIRRLSESARADLLATEEARQGIILSLVAETAGTYLQLLGLDEQLAISKQSLATYAESVKLFENQYAYGQVSQMTVEQARTQYETAAAAIPQIELQIVQTENALSILLGRNPGPVPRGRTLDKIAMPEIPAGLPSDVLAGRPDIRQAEQTLIALNARIGAAKALYFPSISLTGDFGYASADLSDLFEGRSRLWSYSGSLTGPIFTGGAIYGQVKQAETARNAALINYELSIQNAFADVENALVARRKLAEKTAAEARLVKAGKEYARLAQLQYDGGYAPYSTVLQAQQQLFPAELTYAQTRASLFSAMVDIYKAMGGGWVRAADRMTKALE
ncbi:MAG: efflux transporter outer membrane subunit [Desulfococcus multivorans]|jgi:multidrug efflux system outer membrane protein|nr:efflux transporter outer membrane subunit [Desulfococcus multivorans]